MIAVPANVRDVALRAGVSVGTVSNVLNRPDKVSPATIDRVQEAIDALGFIRNEAARQLRVGRSSSIGLVVLDVRNPFYTDLARGAEDAAGRSGLSVILGNSDDDPSREAAYLDLFEEQRVHGVLISPHGDIAPRLAALQQRGIPSVVVDGRAEGFSSVAVDDVAGGRMAVEHLLQQGRRRIAFLGGPSGIRQVDERLAGARAAAPDLEVLEAAALTVLEGRRIGRELAARAERPDAVFAANDLLAVGLLQGLQVQGGVRVPDEIALIGYDDIDFATSTVVPLSSVRQPTTTLGERAVELLLEQASDTPAPTRSIVFTPELVVRESTAAQRD